MQPGAIRDLIRGQRLKEPDSREWVSWACIDRQRRQQSVLSATRQIFQESGVRSVTVRRIAHYSGCSVPTIYSLVGNRDMVLERALLSPLDGCIAAASEISRHNGINGVLALADAFWAATAVQPAFSRHQLDLLSARPEGRRLSQMFTQRVTQATLCWIESFALHRPEYSAFSGEQLAKNIERGLRSAALAWLHGSSNIIALRRDLALGAGAILIGFVSSDEARRIVAWIDYVQQAERRWTMFDGCEDFVAKVALNLPELITP